MEGDTRVVVTLRSRKVAADAETLQEGEGGVLKEGLVHPHHGGGQIESGQVRDEQRGSHGGDRRPLVGPGEGGHAVGVPAHPRAVERCQQAKGDGPQQQAGGPRLGGTGETAAPEVVGVETTDGGDRIGDLEQIARGSRRLSRTLTRQGTEERGLDPGAVRTPLVVGELGGRGRLPRHLVAAHARTVSCRGMATLDQISAISSPLVKAVVKSAGLSRGDRHPLAPAAVRLERTSARRGGESADQMAITVWLGEGPSLPVPGISRSPWRTAAGVGITLIGAAAVAAASTLAAQREQDRRRLAARPVAALPTSSHGDRRAGD